MDLKTGSSCIREQSVPPQRVIPSLMCRIHSNIITVKVMFNPYINFEIDYSFTSLQYTPITLYPTAPLYNIVIIFDAVLRQKRNFLNTKNNEFNSVAIFPLWHVSPRLALMVGNVKIALSENIDCC